MPLIFAGVKLLNVLENARESLRWLPRMQGRRICQYPKPRHFLLNREACRLAKGVPFWLRAVGYDLGDHLGPLWGPR